MFFPFAFSIVWTIACILMFAATFDDRTTGDVAEARLILPVFILAGLFAVRYTYRRYKRYQSLREIRGDDGMVYVWIELDGSECRSSVDPREEWDASDGDGDGDGGGD